MKKPRTRVAATTALAYTQEVTGVNALLHRLQVATLSPFVRAVNYHGLPPAHVARFEEHLRWYADHFVSVGLDDLVHLQNGAWPHARPGLLLSFDDGQRSVYDHALPMLERHGFRGWLMIPPGFIEAPAAEQYDYAQAHAITSDIPSRPAQRVAMSWDEVRDAARRGHVIGSHTYTHHRLPEATSDEALRREVVASKAVLDRELRAEVATFCWVGGEEQAYSARAAAAIRDAGYRVGLMTNNDVFRPGDDLLHVQRSNVEAAWPLPVVRFLLSGVMDVYYAPQRRRVARVTGGVGAQTRKK
jgi:peptidoglycan/xylan/chitin deacetylase (PgdA/CDA1 family)